MSRKQDDISLARFWAPRYWHVWLLLFWLRCSVHLPFRWQIRIGKRFGRIIRPLMRRSLHGAARNLEICFPELDDDERRQLLIRYFESLGASVAEMALGWFAPQEQRRELIQVEGLEHLLAAKEKGEGILLFVGHFTCIEVGVSIIGDHFDSAGGMYKPAKNEMLDALIRHGRSRSLPELVPDNNVRGLVSDLRNNKLRAYVPDHAHIGGNSVLLPFFGEPALTTTATSRLAKLSGATVLPYFFHRLPDDSGYVINISPPLADFPSDDPVADTQRLVTLLEDNIRRSPDQYIWTYRRFKGRPPEYPDIYRKD
ncbi:MAG: lipid A biosynthesis lauroyl acyltransferase [Candidatus Rariloculaceae bacterium]